MKIRSITNTAVVERQGTPATLDTAHDEVRTDTAEFNVNPLTIARVQVILVGLLLVVGTSANVIIYHVAPSPEHGLAKVMQRFDLGHEPSLPAWYSSLALVVCSGLLCLIATVKKRREQSFVTHWFALAVIFLLMGLDEAVMIHEMADNLLHNWLETSGILYFAWVIPGTFVVLAVGVAYLSFLKHLDKRTRWLFVFSGIVFVSGAIGMELIAGIIFTVGDGVHSLAHTASQAVEEGCEMLGIVLFIYALVDFIGRDIGLIICRTNVARVLLPTGSVVET